MKKKDGEKMITKKRLINKNFTLLLGKGFVNKSVGLSILPSMITIKAMDDPTDEFPFIDKCSKCGMIYLQPYFKNGEKFTDSKYLAINYMNDGTIIIVPYGSYHLSIMEDNNWKEMRRLLTMEGSHENKCEERILNIVIVSKNKIDFSVNAGNLSDGSLFWIYPFNDTIVASRYRPQDLSAAEIRKVHKQRRKEGFTNILSLTPGLKDSGIKNSDLVAIIEKGEDVIFRKATEKEINNYRSTKAIQQAAVDGEVRNIKFLYFTEDTKKKMGLVNGCWVSIKICINDGCWLEIKKAEDTSNLRTYSDMKKAYNKKPTLEFEYKFLFNGNIQLPMFFVNEAIPDQVKGNVKLPYYMEENNTFVLEGLPLICECCGKKVYRGKRKKKENSYEKDTD